MHCSLHILASDRAHFDQASAILDLNSEEARGEMDRSQVYTTILRERTVNPYNAG